MHPPILDTRQVEDLIEQMKRMAPHYAPEWRFSPEDPDAGSALFFIFADMYMENLKRLNKAPLKHFMAFLNMMDIQQLPAQTARARVVFELSEGMLDSVHIPKGTQVSAKSEVGHDIIYETNNAYLVTPAKIADVLNVSKTHDRIVRITEEVHHSQPFQLFSADGVNLQAHAFYIKQDAMFHVKHGAAIDIVLGNDSESYNNAQVIRYLSNPQNVTWSYFHHQQWVPFEEIGNREDRAIVLYKSAVQANERNECFDLEGHWVKCHLHHYDPNDGFLSVLKIDEARCKTDYFEKEPSRGIAPDFLFFNDLQVSNDGHYPFGEEFAVFSAYYIAADEVFSKKGAQVDLTFDLRWDEKQIRPPFEPEIEWKMVMKKSQFEKKPALATSIAQVAWEYWDGNTWAKLTNDPTFEQVFHYREQLQMSPTISFKCPADFEINNVNGHDHYWVRVRVISIENLYSTDFLYLSPWISNIGLTYRSIHTDHPIEQFFTRNNLEGMDRSQQTRILGQPFRLFYNVELDQPAVYFGFDQVIQPGIHHLYFSIQSQSVDGIMQQMPLIDWEFAGMVNGKNQWVGLKVIDETKSFTESGFVKFIVPQNTQKVAIMDQTLFWIRAVNRDFQYEQRESSWELPRVQLMYLNGVDVLQQETIREEMIDAVLDEETYESNFKLLNTPCSDEEIWVDETETISQEEIQFLQIHDSKAIELMHDSDENIMEVWVKWQAVNSLATSSAGDRHYVINRTSGMLQFGDDQKGKALPPADTRRIKAHYKKIKGSTGNVASKQIKSLQSALAFIEKVYNPESAIGGSQAESIEHAILRGPAHLQHRNRCVTAKDFEAITREANLNIAKVKCLSRQECPELVPAGSITIVAQPQQALAARADFPGLKRQIEQYLLKRATQFVAFPELIRVIEPAYLEIGVYAIVSVQSTDDMYRAEQLIEQKLTTFLNPNHGNFHEKGWEIGETFHISMLYGVIKSIPEIATIKQLSLTVHRVENGERAEIDPQQMSKIKHGVIMSGLHRVSVEVKSRY